MPAFHERMPSGIPGDISRKDGATVESAIVAGNPIAFGSPVQLDGAGKLTGPAVADNAVYGFLVRPYPAQATSEADHAFGGGKAQAGAVADVLRSGYMTVRLAAAEGSAPVKGAPVKVVFAATGGFVAGDIAASQGTVVPGCFFMGGADTNGNAEIAFNI